MGVTLAAARLVGSVEEVTGASGDVKLQYDSQPHYEKLAAGFGMLLEWRDGVPRGAYKGVVCPASTSLVPPTSMHRVQPS